MPERPDLEQMQADLERRMRYASVLKRSDTYLQQVLSYAFELERQHAASQERAEREKHEEAQRSAELRDEAMEVIAESRRLHAISMARVADQRDTADRRAATLARELGAAKKALARFGQHVPGCVFERADRCSCGYAAALAAGGEGETV